MVVACRHVDLGFLTPLAEDENISSCPFLSKVGGKPVWLDKLNIPSTDRLKCKYCEEPTSFLLQIYTPMDSDNCYHRAVYIFCCQSYGCHLAGLGCFQVFRNQLSKENVFYSSDGNVNVSAKTCPLCFVCGCRGNYLCGRCRATRYCCRAHQLYDWKINKHRITCLKDVFPLTDSQNTFLWPEYTMDIGSEEVLSSENELTSDSEEEYSPSDKPPFDERNFEKDKFFLHFQEAMQKNPEQVLRYVRDCPEGVLWISDEDIPDSKIPDCPLCNGKRILEFQVLPQLLNYLGGTEIDWGILAVYTCSVSCATSNFYALECIRRQFVSSRPAVELLV
ncbi:programmed cell death protein 2-like isoform X2 [Zophobas morio]|uniref:programmed cell death protein 2-like isoform X2 n=1 Tax=Zophobas morio TaxID=2755281 RepID=UPI0030832B5D